MKRRPALRQLLREHHRAPVLALRIARTSDANAVAHLATTVPELFTQALEPHFRDEEHEVFATAETLLPGDILDAAPPVSRATAVCRLAPE